MTDIISFDVELTQNQKLAQDKLNQVHQLYDEIEKLLGTQDVFNKPHMLLVLPNKLKKEPMTSEEWLRSATFEELAGAIYEWYSRGWAKGKSGKLLEPITELVEWLKQQHTKE